MRRMTTSVEPLIWVFFYGSYMNFDVLAEVNMKPERWEVARLPGYDLVIRPRANLLRAESAVAWGIVATATHSELARLYAHSRDVLGQAYWPHPAVAETANGTLRPALVYLSHDMQASAADAAYVARIAGPARAYGFPPEYLAKIMSFA
jgi:cation transport regulator ChaC